MRATYHDRSFLTRSTAMTLASLLIWSMAVVLGTDFGTAVAFAGNAKQEAKKDGKKHDGKKDDDKDKDDDKCDDRHDNRNHDKHDRKCKPHHPSPHRP